MGVNMSHYPEELQYSETHEWALQTNDTNIVTVGITDYLQQQLGEIEAVELPEVGLKIIAGDDVCVLESVKVTAEIISPLSGRIVAVNEDLEESPGLINIDPYQDGWLFKLELKDRGEYDELMDVSAYQELLAELEED